MQLILAVRFHSILLAVALGFGACFSSDAQQTTITSTAGSGDLNTTINPSGNTFNIGGGTRFGNSPSLFHSFDQFSVGSGDTANFNNDIGPGIANILSRVTGGNLSNVFGTIQTTGFPGADLYLINPAGVVFGPDASLNVEGGFYVSTAHFVEFGNGARFDAATGSPVAPELAVASPAAFGFLSENPGRIDVNTAFLEVQQGQSLSLVGGALDISQSDFSAPSGAVNIVSVGSGGTAQIEDGIITVAEQQPQGQITLDDSFIFADTPVFGVEEDASAGHILISGGRVIINGGTLDTQGFNAGRAGDIDISGHAVMVDQTQVLTAGRGDGPAGDIRISAQDTVTLNGANLVSISRENNSGNINISAGWDVIMDGSDFPTVLQSATNFGEAGIISISSKEGNITINNSIFDTETPFGTPASLDLSAENGLIALGEGTLIRSQTISSDAGSLTITARELRLSEEAKIQGRTIGTGRGANVVIKTATLNVNGGAEISVDTIGPGIGGSVEVEADTVNLSGGARLAASTIGMGTGGSVNINAAGGDVTVQGHGADGNPSAITTESNANDENSGIAGNAGSIMITAGRFVVRDGGEVSATTETTGTGGDVKINATEVLLTNGGSISAESPSPDLDSGESGSIDIHASDSFEIFNGSSVSVETRQATAGNIDLEAGSLLHLNNQGSITTSARGGDGDGGNINIDPIFVILEGGSRIVAQAEEGRGGNINIVTDFLFQSPDSVIDASSEQGIDGSVEIDSPDTDIIAGSLQLPEAFANVAAVLGERCSARFAKDSSSFVLGGRSGIPPSPETMIPGSITDIDLVPVPSNNTTSGMTFVETASDIASLMSHPISTGCVAD